jgi:hypothetical protein
MGFRSWFNPAAAREMARQKAHAALGEVADYAAARAVDYAPVRTGFLASHIRSEELANGLGYRVVATAFYASHVHARIPFLALGLADAARIWPTVARAQATTSVGSHNPEGFLSTTFTT